MTAQTGMTQKQKLESVRAINDLASRAQTLILDGKRSWEDAKPLIDALQAFKDNRLGGVVRTAMILTPNTLNEICSLEITAISFDAKDLKWLKARGIRYIGEIFYVHFDKRSKYSIERGKRVFGLIEDRFRIQRNTDPLRSGWTPSYWTDEAFLNELDVCLLERSPTPPEPNWGQVIGDTRRWWNKRHEMWPASRGPARLMHSVTGARTVGEIIGKEKVSQYCPNGKRSSTMLKAIKKNLDTFRSNLWAGAQIPSTWEAVRHDILWSDEHVYILSESEKCDTIFNAIKEEQRIRQEADEELERSIAQIDYSERLDAGEGILILDRRIDEDSWYVRTENALQNRGVTTYGQLVVLEERDLLNGKSFGRKSLNEVKENLAEISSLFNVVPPLKVGMTAAEILALRHKGQE